MILGMLISLAQAAVEMFFKIPSLRALGESNQFLIKINTIKMRCMHHIGIADVRARVHNAGNRVWGRIGDGEDGDIQVDGSLNDALAYSMFGIYTKSPI